MKLIKRLLLGVLLYSGVAAAQVSVVDDAGNRVTLPDYPSRIISLAPHITDLLFAAGGGDKVVGVVNYSDYPPAAKQLPIIGSYVALDFEQILALKPDLVVAWQGGNPAAMRDKVAALGIPMFLSEPHELDDVADGIERLAKLMGTESAAAPAIKQYRDELAALQLANRGKTPVRVFYEIWNQPLMTINGGDLISKVIKLCGGDNIFAELQVPAPQVSREAVLLADPQIIIGSGMAYERPEWLDEWRRWPEMAAVKGDHLVAIHPDIIQRYTPRILLGAQQMCDYLDEVRVGLKRK